MARRERHKETTPKRMETSQCHTSNRPQKLRMWSNEAMVGAMDAVAEGRMGVNRAALEFGVPPTTLKDRIAGRVVHGTKSGPKPYLTHEEEQKLVEFLINCSKMGRLGESV